MAKAAKNIGIPGVTRAQVITLVVLLVIVIISYFVISNWLANKKASKIDEQQRAIFAEQNTIAYSPSESPITQTQANAFVQRIIDDASFWTEDWDVWPELNQLDNANLATVNNAFVENFADMFDYKYTTLKQMIKGENWSLSPNMQAVIDRLPA